MPPAHHCAIRCRNILGPRDPGLSDPTSRLRLALPMAPTKRQQIRVLYGSVSRIFGARRRVMIISNLSESLAKPLVMAKLNMVYLSSLKNRAKLLLSSLPVSSSRVLRAPGTSPYHSVPKHLQATWPRPEQSHPPSGDQLFQWHRQQTTN